MSHHWGSGGSFKSQDQEPGFFLLPNTSHITYIHTTHTLHKASDSRPYVALLLWALSQSRTKLVNLARVYLRVVPQMSASG